MNTEIQSNTAPVLPLNLFFTSKIQFQKYSHSFENNGFAVNHTDKICNKSTLDSLDIYILSEEFLKKHEHEVQSIGNKKDRTSLLYFIGNDKTRTAYDSVIDFRIQEPVDYRLMQNMVENGFRMLQSRFENAFLRQELKNRNKHIQELSHIGQQLMMEKNLQTLLELILLKCRQITQADGGSLYLVEKENEKERCLRFKITQNDSVSFDFQEFTIPLSRKSIAGYVADTGKMLNLEDVKNIPADSEFTFNRSFDKKTGYITKSMLVIPLHNHLDEIIGVIQLINRKNDWDLVLKDPADFEKGVGPFTDGLVEMVTSLAGQAAISIENNYLYRSIERLFEGFVNASVTAIESRDPTTSGHSSRVATLTEHLAHTVDRVNNGPLCNIRFSADQIKELRYASLLHDFGKVGVSENVLLKAKKLYPHESKEIQYRIGYMKKTEELRNWKERVRFLLDYGSRNYQLVFNDLDIELNRKLLDLDRIMQLINEFNEPTVTDSDIADKLEELAELKFFDYEDNEKLLLKPAEFEALSIKRGSLDEKERFEIESHVSHTFNFLKKVPWTKEFSSIPDIALAHHEKLNGSGYPNRIKSDKIPIQSKMMSVCDIFDALTAADRPYKKAVPYDRALTILQYEVEDDHIDPDLVKVFIDAKIFKSVIKDV